MQLHSGRDKRVEGLKQHIPPGSCGEVTGRVFLSTFMGLRCSPKKKKGGGWDKTLSPSLLGVLQQKVSCKNET